MIVEYFYNPEKLLRSRLGKNPVYPFVVVEPNVFVTYNTPKRHITAAIICGVVLLATVVICITTAHVTQYIIVPILIFIYFMPQMFAVRGPRTLVVDFNQYSYEVSKLTSTNRLYYIVSFIYRDCGEGILPKAY